MKRGRSRSRSRDKRDRRRSSSRDAGRNKRRRSRDSSRDNGRRDGGDRSNGQRIDFGRGDDFRYAPDGSKIAITRKEKDNVGQKGGPRTDQRQQPGQPASSNREPRSAFSMLWPPSVDKALFDTIIGTEKIRRGTAEYYDFKDFYAKYLEVKDRKAAASGAPPPPKFKSRDEADKAKEAEVRSVVTLFATFTEKQKAEKKEEMLKHRKGLPIFPFKEQILSLLAEHDIILVAGDTGCGKSTQVPQFLLDSPEFTSICVTQPRRIACYALARRVAEERGEERGSEVGYQVRFVRTATRQTRLIFATEGVVARQVSSSSNGLLDQYDVVVVDEVHERHLQCDFLVAVLKGIVAQRKKLASEGGVKRLKLVLMSATMDLELWSKYLGDCPVVEVPGRLHPVLVHYRPSQTPDRNLLDPTLRAERLEVAQSVPVQNTRFVPDPFLRILGEIEARVPWNERGDVLIFLPGVQEIDKLQVAAGEWARQKARDRGEAVDSASGGYDQEASTGPWIILPLHSTLPVAEQELVFRPAPPGRRKLVLATNIAETSVTLPEIRFVVDSGRAREMDYSGEGTRVARLREFWVSRSSARQRAGRAGRTGPGECWRLWSEPEEEGMNEWGVPEVRRVPLEQIVLEVLSLGLGDPRKVDFVEPPPEKSVDAAIRRLRNLGALVGDRGLERATNLGLLLSRLPIEPGLGKMLVLAAILSKSAATELVEPLLTVAAGLSVQSPYSRAGETDQNLRRNRRELESEHGDMITLLNLYSEWLTVKSRGSADGWCRRLGVEQQRLYEIVKMREQFGDVLEDAGEDEQGDEDEEEGYNGPRRRRRRKRAWLGLDKEEEEEDREVRKQKRIQREALDRQRQMLGADKPKVLEVGREKQGDDEGQTQDISKMSIHDLEFALRYGSSSTALLNQAEFSSVASLTATQLSLIKLIVCSGLYPNMAIPDEANPQRREGEQTFHTRGKKMVGMHPSSVFSAHVEWAYPSDVDGGVTSSSADANTLLGLHRKRHAGELLCYQNLLETSGKPYLLNSLKVPSVHVCLLFARSIDTSPDLGKLLVDDWLSIKFRDSRTAERALVLSSWLRTALEYVVSRSLRNVVAKSGAKVGFAGDTRSAVASLPKLPKDAASAVLPPVIERIRADCGTILAWEAADEDGDEAATPDEVARALSEFLEMEIAKGALVEMAKGSEVQAIFPLYDFATGEGPKPGIPVTPFLRYASLPPSSSTSQSTYYLPPPPNMAQFYKCAWCSDFEGVVTRGEVDAHLKTCQGYTSTVHVFRPKKKTKEEIEAENEAKEADEARKREQEKRAELTGGKNWLCPACGDVLQQGTPVEILKHKRMCVGRTIG